ncbi:2',3'-cyclic-nucleotide 2'-phosphodiesterase [Rhodobacter sp. SGA-6-6]|uniref:5'-nucleotidase C-terminal domain-containing protein n=1 Tax=Rhodobacter sp. SGA-6-6 TaxID=2710882 RepID=UPI0013EDDD61|nr:2',3'-cyclic-nucleotide 2'-phosphodiesterase [Rhodobacter sp. SGA-6-6]
MRPARHGATLLKLAAGLAEREPEPLTQPAETAPLPEPAADRQDEVLLRVLATTDLHANILSYDYAANRPLHGQGLAQMAGLIAAARAGAPGALLLDNGDFLQGSALADLAAQGGRRRVHPVIGAMNALAYDAATLGNHEFNYGLPVLDRALAEARFPVVSANVLRRRGEGGPLEDDTLAPPYAILDRVLADGSGRPHRLRIGILGLTPPEILRWDQAHLSGRLDARPMVEAARARLPELRRAGADLVICLAHTGLAGPGGREGIGIELAELPGIDALVLGHSHLVFPHRGLHPDARVDAAAGRVAGKPVVQPGHSGSHLGIMDLRLRRGAGSWTVAGAEVRAESVSEVAAGLPAAAIRRHAEELRRAVGPDHRAALAWTRRELGRTEVALSTAFAQVADVAALRLLGLAKIDHARRALAGTAWEGLPVLATATPYRAGGRGGPLNYTRIAPGPLSVRHVFDLYPFPNTVVGVLVTGAELAEELERAAALYAQVVPGRAEQRLIDPAFPAHAFTTVIGISYRIDPSLPARYDPRGALVRPQARRVLELRRGGVPVRPDDRFVLVTNSFRASGALGGGPFEVVLDRHELCTAILRDHILRQGRIGPDTLAPAEGWSLRPLPGTSVVYDSGPEAMEHRSEAAHLRPEGAGLTAEGFQRLRLYL